MKNENLPVVPTCWIATELSDVFVNTFTSRSLLNRTISCSLNCQVSMSASLNWFTITWSAIVTVSVAVTLLNTPAVGANWLRSSALLPLKMFSTSDAVNILDQSENSSIGISVDLSIGAFFLWNIERSFGFELKALVVQVVLPWSPIWTPSK